MSTKPLPFFFFQAEDGIRDFHVTRVQTCALPIWRTRASRDPKPPRRATTSRTQSSTARPRASLHHDREAAVAGRIIEELLVRQRPVSEREGARKSRLDHALLD